MAYIELVIKIPEEEYEDIINSEDCGLHILTRAIAKGTPLPNTLEYLETAYTGARACDDVAEQVRLARAIAAYKQDVHEDCTLSQARKNGLWIVEKGDRSTGYGGGLIVCSRCSTEGQAEW